MAFLCWRMASTSIRSFSSLYFSLLSLGSSNTTVLQWDDESGLRILRSDTGFSESLFPCATMVSVILRSRILPSSSCTRRSAAYSVLPRCVRLTLKEGCHNIPASGSPACTARKLILLQNLYLNPAPCKQLIFQALLHLINVLLLDQMAAFQMDPDKIPVRISHYLGYFSSFKSNHRSSFNFRVGKYFKKRFTHSSAAAPVSMSLTILLPLPFFNDFPFFNQRPSPMPPAIPISASLASPGPLTTQP